MEVLNIQDIAELTSTIVSFINNQPCKNYPINYIENKLELTKASSKYDEYFNLIFCDIEITTANFNNLEKKLAQEDASIVTRQDWNNYPAVIIEEIAGLAVKNLKIQSSSKDTLQINIKSDVNINHLQTIIALILKIKNNIVLPPIPQKLYELLQKNEVEPFIEKNFNIEADESYWNLRIYGNFHFSYWYDKAKDKRYLNCHGFYMGKDISEFESYLKKLFNDHLEKFDYEIDLNCKTRLGSDVSYELEVKFKDINDNYSANKDFKIIYTNPSLFAINFDSEESLLNSYAFDFIDLLIGQNSLAFGNLKIEHDNSIEEASKVIHIGIINEFGFPYEAVTDPINDILAKLGYIISQDNLYQYDKLSLHDGKIAANECSYIIYDIYSKKQISRLKESFPNMVFIACGLEHGLTSVSKQKLVKEYKRRFEKIEHLRFTEEDFSNITRNLDPLINEEFKNFQDDLNECYHLADFFINYVSDNHSKLSKYKIKQQLKRFMQLLHGYPYGSPTKDEYLMYMAFSAALRSADLSRQVGAVIATKIGDIIATGANDIPKSGGGLYWARVHPVTGEIYDTSLGRDYIRGFDSNVVERKEIIDEICNKNHLDISIKNILEKSRLKDITEYGRVVHAEMEALMACARNNTSTLDTTLYCTTFPCHNCAKHIIASGISRVVYIEPYAKSKALPFHLDSIVDEDEKPIQDTLANKLAEFYGEGSAEIENEIYSNKHKVKFEGFIGVGPRLFRDVFIMNKDSRKNRSTGIVSGSWTPKLIQFSV